MPETDELVDCPADQPAMRMHAEPMHAEDSAVTIVSATDAGAAIARRIKLPCISVTPEREALSRMIGCGCSVETAGSGALLSLQFARNAQVEWTDALMLAGPFGTIELADGVRLLRALTGIDPGAQIGTGDARWDWLQSAVVGRLAATPFAAVERLTRDVQPQRDDACTLRIRLQSSGHVITTYARADAGSWIEFLAGTAWTKDQRPFSDFAGLPFESMLRIARHTLPRHVLKGLAAGDLILPDQVFFGTRGAGYVQLGVLYARIRYQQPNSFTIASAEVKVDSLELKESLQDEGGNAPPETHAASRAGSQPVTRDGPEPLANTADMDSVPVTLNFELGKVRMSLGELRALTLESIITFTGSSSSIAVRCGEKLLGRGELVDVNGKLGVRILEWGPTC